MSDLTLTGIETGTYLVTVTCPDCGEVALIPARIGVRLTVPDDDPATLRVTLKAKAVEHMCRQTSIDSDTGELLTHGGGR